jgi:hypothetical protein
LSESEDGFSPHTQLSPAPASLPSQSKTLSESEDGDSEDGDCSDDGSGDKDAYTSDDETGEQVLKRGGSTSKDTEAIDEYDV